MSIAMKYFGRWFAATVLTLPQFSVLSLYADVQNTAKAFAVSLSGPAATLKVGAPCEVTISVKNISKEKKALIRTNGGEEFFDYVVYVQYKGKMLVAHGPFRPRAADGTEIPLQHSRQIERLEPGASLERKIDLNALFDLSKPGDYTVNVDRRVPPEYGGGLVRSNTISITIIQ